MTFLAHLHYCAFAQIYIFEKSTMDLRFGKYHIFRAFFMDFTAKMINKQYIIYDWRMNLHIFPSGETIQIMCFELYVSRRYIADAKTLT